MTNKHFGVYWNDDNDTSLAGQIKFYYKQRGLTFPDFDSAMKFVQTELAEVYEIDLARKGDWVRNNPENKPKFDKRALSEELGDAIMMLIVAGIAEGVDPIDSLISKMARKLEQNSTATVTSSVQIISAEQAQEVITEVHPSGWMENIVTGERIEWKLP